MTRFQKSVACAAIVFLAFAALGSRYELPILMYHQIGRSSERSSVHVSPETFERQMQFLKVHDYRVWPLEDVVAALKQRRKLPPKTVAITFDDGTLDTIQNAFPVLKQMEFPATVFMITDNIGRPGWLSEEDLRVLDAGGVHIGSHTVHHAFLPDIDDRQQVLRELTGSKRALEDILGHPVTLFSYPAGGVTESIRELVKEAGYEGAVTTNYFKRKHDVYALHRVKISEGGGSLFNFLAKVSGWYHLGKKRIEREAMA